MRGFGRENTRNWCMRTMLIVILVVFVSCNSVTPKEAPPPLQYSATDATLVELPSGEIVPAFSLKPIRSREAYYGVGFAELDIPHLALQQAAVRARADIASQLVSNVQQVVRVYARDSGIPDDPSLTEYMEILSKSVSAATMEGLVIVHRVPVGGGAWVLAKLDMSQVNAALEKGVEQAYAKTLSGELSSSLATWNTERVKRYLDSIQETQEALSKKFLIE